MKLGVSNIAWQKEQHLQAYALLAKYGFSGLEIAPALYFFEDEDSFNPSQASITKNLSILNKFNLELISMQSLLFGVNGAALFEGENRQKIFIHGIRRAITLAGLAKIPNLVFGSPKNRIIPCHMDYMTALVHAVEIFRNLGDAANAVGTTLAIECNPVIYGTNFLTDSKEVSHFVKLVNHPAITMNLDIGAMIMNNEISQIEALLTNNISHISHVHISEANLNPAPQHIHVARDVLQALRDCSYNGWVSIEMKTEAGRELVNLETCLSRLAEASAS